jgi:hypothetical protein
MGAVRSCEGEVHFLVGDQEPVLDQLPIETRLHEEVVVLTPRGVDLPVQDPLSDEDEPTRIAEGARNDRRAQSSLS